MAAMSERCDAVDKSESANTVRIVLPDYRKRYAANDFTDSRTRSLDNAVANYLSKSAIRPWWIAPRKMVLRIAEKSRDIEQEKITTEAYREMFAWRARGAVRRFVRQLPVAITLVVIGISVLWISNQVDEANMEKDVRSTVSDVVQVGAWVALWSAISLVFSTGFESLASYIAFRRLARIPIEFEYDNDLTGKRKARQTARRIT